jgi:hypothetical protein
VERTRASERQMRSEARISHANGLWVADSAYVSAWSGVAHVASSWTSLVATLSAGECRIVAGGTGARRHRGCDVDASGCLTSAARAAAMQIIVG